MGSVEGGGLLGVPRMPVVGVLELQGAFAEHHAMLKKLGQCRVVGVRLPEHIAGVDAMVLPGGESTTQSKLLVDLEMLGLLRSRVEGGMPIFGTCAGAILLSRTIATRPEQPRIGCLHATIQRNAYGRQQDSHESTVQADPNAFGAKPLQLMHIRAPAFQSVGKNVQVLAKMGDTPVLVRQSYILAATFHPELTDDTRVHKYFLAMVRERLAALTPQKQ